MSVNAFKQTILVAAKLHILDKLELRTKEGLIIGG